MPTRGRAGRNCWKQSGRSTRCSRRGWALKCEGVTGWIQYKEGDVHLKVTFETRHHDKAPLGVVSCRMQFEMKRDGKVQQTVDATAKLIDFGRDARTALPDYK